MFVTRPKLGVRVFGVVLGMGMLATAPRAGTPLSLPAAANAFAHAALLPVKEPAKPAGIEALLRAKDFWARIGKKTEHPDLRAEARTLRTLAEKLKDAAVRIRATKLLADLDGRSKSVAGYRPVQVEAAVEGAFRHLEANLMDLTVQKFRPQLGFSHLTVSRKAGDASGVWLLIEMAQAGEPSSGLNIRWDSTHQRVDQVQHWGWDRSLREDGR